MMSAANDSLKREMTFDVAMTHPTELEVVDLRPMADVVLETGELSVSETVAELKNVVRSILDL
jgi:hypothetical protein